MWFNPANPTQQYWTGIPNDPNIPAGYVDSRGSDGAQPEAVKVYTAGVNNQGAGAVGYRANSDADPQQRTDQPLWPNGILNGYGGGGTTQADVRPAIGQPVLYGKTLYGLRRYGGYN